MNMNTHKSPRGKQAVSQGTVWGKDADEGRRPPGPGVGPAVTPGSPHIAPISGRQWCTTPSGCTLGVEVPRLPVVERAQHSEAGDPDLAPGNTITQAWANYFAP